MLAQFAAFAAVLAVQTAGLPAIVKGRQVLVDGVPIHIKGVNWNPVPAGTVHPGGLDFVNNVREDSYLMKEAGINVLRTYMPIMNRTILDILWENGIQVLNTVYASGGESLNLIEKRVNSVKDHPAILMWVVGNEWNYNRLYTKMPFAQTVALVGSAAAKIRQYDTTHPVATIYGELPSAAVIQQLSASGVDVWGINYYDGLSFGDLFYRWAARSDAPMFLGEYGADAYDTEAKREDQEAQALATLSLTREIVDQSTIWEGGVCLGGFIFELADEWWKDARGSPRVQESGGLAPGGGPYPDGVFNEEWWGLTDIHRNPRRAYKVYAGIVPPSVNMTAGLLSVRASPAATRLSCTSGGCTTVPIARTPEGARTADVAANTAIVDPPHRRMRGTLV